MACIHAEVNSLKNAENTVHRYYFPVFARVRVQAPHVFAQKLLPQKLFHACTGFVPGGYVLVSWELQWGWPLAAVCNVKHGDRTPLV